MIKVKYGNLGMMCTDQSFPPVFVVAHDCEIETIYL